MILAMVLSGCGTYATPVWQATTPTAVSVASVGNVQVVSQATSAPSDTPIPPTPTSEPTSTPTEELTQTIEPTPAQIASPIDRLVVISDAENGEILFNTFQASTGFACGTCHSADSEKRLIGPGLLNIKDRAGNRVEGQSVAEYINNSIKNPNEYIVDSFPADLMPTNWSEVYSDNEIFDIVAYLMTLEGEAVTSDSTGSSDTSDVPISSGLTELPETANAENGAELFQTFQPDAGFACSTCHQPESEARLIGPGLLNVAIRAETRIEGQTALEYIFTSITNPSVFVVPEFPDELMPANWAEIYSEDEIYDIMAYLLTLQE